MEQPPLSDEFTAPHFSTSALLVIDVQNDFLDGGSCPVPGTSDRLPQIDELLEAFRRAGPWSAFHRTPLDDHLSTLGVDTIVLAGCNFPNCPRATAFDASARDLRIVLAQDAVSQATPDRIAEAICIGVVPMTVRDIAAALPAIA